MKSSIAILVTVGLMALTVASSRAQPIGSAPSTQSPATVPSAGGTANAGGTPTTGTIGVGPAVSEQLGRSPNIAIVPVAPTAGRNPTSMTAPTIAGQQGGSAFTPVNPITVAPAPASPGASGRSSGSTTTGLGGAGCSSAANAFGVSSDILRDCPP